MYRVLIITLIINYGVFNKGLVLFIKYSVILVKYNLNNTETDVTGTYEKTLIIIRQKIEKSCHDD